MEHRQDAGSKCALEYDTDSRLMLLVVISLTYTVHSEDLSDITAARNESAIFAVEEVSTNLENQQLFVEFVPGHGGWSSVTVWDVVSLDIHLHLLLLQKQQQLELLTVVLPAQRTFKQVPLEQTKWKVRTFL